MQLSTAVSRYRYSTEKIRESYEVLDKYGNLAGASLPFILDLATRKDGLEKRDYAVMLNYGWGFNANVSLITF